MKKAGFYILWFIGLFLWACLSFYTMIKLTPKTENGDFSYVLPWSYFIPLGSLVLLYKVKNYLSKTLLEPKTAV